MADPKDAASERTAVWRWGRRLAPALILLAVVVAGYASGLMDQLSLDGLSEHRAAWTAAVAAHRVQSLGLFVVAYAVFAGSGLPVALILSLAGGLLFGTFLGGVGIILGSTLAALPAYFAVRSALGPWVMRRCEKDVRMRQMIEKLSRNGFAFVLVTRLLPIFPFLGVNLAAGLAGVPLRTYFLATMLAAIPVSFIYAGLGAGIGASLDAHSLSAAVKSPQVLVPLLALSVLSMIPLVIRGVRRGA